MASSVFSWMVGRVFSPGRRTGLPLRRRRSLRCEAMEQRQLLSASPVDIPSDLAELLRGGGAGAAIEAPAAAPLGGDLALAAKPGPAAPKAWTVMVYMDGDNDLEEAALQDFKEMASVSNPNVNIVVQLDRINGYSKAEGDWTTAKRFLVQQGMKPTAQNAIMEIGEADMGNLNTLRNFVTWAESNYQATNYALVLWNHGSGWQDGVCWDQTTPGPDESWLTLSDLRDALSAVPNLQVLGMDACLMGQLEVAYQLRGLTDYFVASAELEPGSGWDYKAILSPKNLTGNTTAADWSQYLVTAYQNYYDRWNSYVTMMSADMGQLDKVDAAFANLAGAMKDNLDSERGNIAAAWSASRYYENYVIDSVDLYDFCDELAARPNINNTLKNAAEDVMSALIGTEGFITKYWSDSRSVWTTDGQRCLSVYFPEVYPSGANPTDTFENYATLDFVKVKDGAGERWMAFLEAYLPSGASGAAAAASSTRGLDARGGHGISAAVAGDLAAAAAFVWADARVGAERNWVGAVAVDAGQVRLGVPAGEAPRSLAAADPDRPALDCWQPDGDLVADVVVRKAARGNVGTLRYCRDAILRTATAETDYPGFPETSLGRKQAAWDER